MMLSFAIQATFITVGVILSILTVHKLDAVSLPQPTPPYPRAPKAVKLVETHAASSSGYVSTRVARPGSLLQHVFPWVWLSLTMVPK